MSTDAREHGGHPPADRDEERDVVDDAGEVPADVAAGAEAEADAPAVPPILSGRSLLRKGLRRWAVMGVVRLSYRWWTRLAAHLFPEDSRRATFAARLGIPLPDRLNLSWITPNLAVGGRVLPADIHRLAARGVTRIVDTRAEHMDDKDALAAEHIDLLYLPAPDTKPLTLDCGCKKSYYAYVYANKPYVIYVCKAFWAAPLTGTDSKGGTLIHEMSHFSVVASTDDWAYGQAAAKSLAISDPAKALDNADSHEYFAENTPTLP